MQLLTVQRPALDRQTMRRIGEQLRQSLEPVVREPLPTRLAELVARLEDVCTR